VRVYAKSQAGSSDIGSLLGLRLGMPIKDALVLINEYLDTDGGRLEAYRISIENNAQVIRTRPGGILRVASDGEGRVTLLNIHKYLIDGAAKILGLQTKYLPDKIVLQTPRPENLDLGYVGTAVLKSQKWEWTQEIPQGGEWLLRVNYKGGTHQRNYRITGACYLLCGGDLILKKDLNDSGTVPLGKENVRQWDLKFESENFDAGKAYTFLVVLTDLLVRTPAEK